MLTRSRDPKIPKQPISDAVLDAYLVVAAALGAPLRTAYLQPDAALAESATRELIIQAEPTIATESSGFTMRGLPSRASLLDAGIDAAIRDAVSLLVVQIRIQARDLPFFRALGAFAPASRTVGVIRGFGVEAPIAGAGYWNAMPEGGRGFGTRAEAERLIGADIPEVGKLTGKKVNVVLIDSGLDPIERQQLDLKWGMDTRGPQHLLYLPEAPPAPRYDHAWYTARHIKALAPHASVHDYAILPPRISNALIPSVMVNARALISDMIQAYMLLEQQIIKANQKRKQPWVVINAWALYKRPPTLRETAVSEGPGLPPNLRVSAVIDENPERMDLDDHNHFLNKLITSMVTTHNVDFVFAAGNCGFASFDPRCGINDRGPGRSIIGPAGHPDVTTVAACRDDMTWIGSSSQGPAIMTNVQGPNEKPDFSAPSGFFENDDAARLFSGTSTACAITGAAMAKLRQANPTLPAQDFRKVLVGSTRKVPPAPQQANRFGAGILNLGDALLDLI